MVGDLGPLQDLRVGQRDGAVGQLRTHAVFHARRKGLDPLEPGAGLDRRDITVSDETIGPAHLLQELILFRDYQFHLRHQLSELLDMLG